jgi:predicted metalloprotease
MLLVFKLLNLIQNLGMKWLGRRGSSNIEDRRGFSGGKLALGGGIGATIVYLLVNFLFGGDVADMTQQTQDPQETEARGVTGTDNSSEDNMAQFASVMLADNEDVWGRIFSENGRSYVKPVMVLFRDRTSSGCGSASSATGPFYCPADQKIYLDLGFFSELKDRFGASGDFANAYVIAHEVGHHVQNLMGTSEKIQNLMQQSSQKEANKLSVALELQADFYAGVWAHYDQQMNDVMEKGDLEEALNAANAIGDDRLQKMSKGVVVPDAFTHGSSAQRMKWFKKGFETGDIRQGNTFSEVY